MPSQDLTIPDYTKEDFDGDAPFEWLYSFSDNPYVLSRLTEKMKALAKSLGVTGFVGLFREYCKAMKTANKAVDVQRQTDFDGQPMELSSGAYLCNEDGVQIQDRFGIPISVCRQPIMPIQRLVNVDTGEESVKLWYKTGARQKTEIVEKSVIASASKILDLASRGVLVNAENAKLLSSYLQEIEWANYDSIPEQRSAGRLGWIKDHGFSPYVDNLIFDGDNSFRHVFNAVSAHGNYESWKTAMRKVRAEKGIGRLFLSASFASVILEPCGLLPFFFHVFGGTGYGKTVGLMIAASVWANPKLGEYITTFDSTGVGREMMLGFLNNLPMCMDEMQIQSAAGQRDFDKMVYNMTEGIGRIRGAKAGGIQRVLSWKNCIITSGERPISNSNSGGGALNRVIECEVTDKIFSDLVGLVNLVSDNYGYAGKEFVDALGEDGVLDILERRQKEIYRELLDMDTTEKQAASASALVAADSFVTDLIFLDGNALTVEEIAPYLTRKEDVDVNRRALEYIYELVLRNPMHFKPNDFGTYSAEIWGKADIDTVYILSNVFEREMFNGGYNARTFLTWAKERGLVEMDRDKRLTKRVRINNMLARCVCLKFEGE